QPAELAQSQEGPPQSAAAPRAARPTLLAAAMPRVLGPSRRLGRFHRPCEAASVRPITLAAMLLSSPLPLVTARPDPQGLHSRPAQVPTASVQAIASMVRPAKERPSGRPTD